MVDAHVSGACVERHAGSSPVLGTIIAEIAQLVEHNLAKVRVASSSLVFRSSLKGCSNGGIGRHEGLKIPWPLRLCGFKSRFEYEIKIAIIWMTNGCDFCFIYLHHICTTELIEYSRIR